MMLSRCRLLMPTLLVGLLLACPAFAMDDAVSHGAAHGHDGAVQGEHMSMEEHKADALHEGMPAAAKEHKVAPMDKATVSSHDNMEHKVDGNVMNHETMNHDAMDHSSMGHEKTDAELMHDHEQMMRDVAEKESAVPEFDISVKEKLGEFIPEGITLVDSTGKAVDLREVITAPTIILPVYYTCPSVCNLLLSTFARILPEVALEPGRELRVISISFDELDTPKYAASKKRNFMASMDGAFPPEHWLFLTGTKENVKRAMDSIGFGFARQGNAFVHAAIAVAVSPDGKIVRYLYGTDFLPFDVAMAATEAAQGKVGLSVKRLLSYCFDYDPKGRRYVFDTMRVAGFSILGFAGLLFLFLMLAGRKKRR